eukprot:1406522-Amphidinium_carterae.1
MRQVYGGVVHRNVHAIRTIVFALSPVWLGLVAMLLKSERLWGCRVAFQFNSTVHNKVSSK